MAATPQIDSLTDVGPDELIIEAAEKLELTEHLLELEQSGYTVVPPEKVAGPEFLDALRDAVVALHRRRSTDAGVRQRLERVAAAGAGELMQFVLFDDPLFVQALLNPVVQTLARYMTGHTCRISMFDAAVKPAGGNALPLHCDTEMTEPYPPISQFCNVTYALSDYSAELGSTVFVPGSHRLMRQPHSGEIHGEFGLTSVAGSMRVPEPVPVTCRAGSIIAWHGLTWHGAVPRTEPGERLSILMYFCRWYLQTQEDFRRHIPDGLLDQHPPRLAQLLDDVPGWAVKDPTFDTSRALLGRVVHPILDVPRP